MSLEFENTFLGLCLNGDVIAQEIDDFVGAWHSSEDGNVELWEFLGFTEQEYRAWVKDPDVIFAIIDARRRGLKLEEVLAANSELRAAARAQSGDDAEDVLDWLRKNYPAADGTSPRP